MGRPISSDAEFENSGKKRRSKVVEDMARHFAQMKGGEPEDYYEQVEQILRRDRDPPEYKDDDLKASGFKPVTYYDYTDAQGGLLYQSVRYQHPGVPNAKQFRQRRKGPDGKWFADAGLVKVPYRWSEIVSREKETIYYTEGEKDADRLAKLGLLATTLAGQQWSPEAAKAFKDREVVILGDHDEAGYKNIQNAVAALNGFAKSVRAVELPGLTRTEDVSDWLDKGHMTYELLELIAKVRPSGIRPTPTLFLNPQTIPLRRWVYKPDYIRQFVSLLISTGGIGKSSLAISESLALVTGKPLLGVQPEEGPLRVWYWNGEDPIEELHRRFAAAMKHYELTEVEIGSNQLFIDSGRTTPIVIAQEDKRIVRLNADVVDEVIASIEKNKIDVVIVDPFVTTHRVSENDNGAIDLVVKAWNRIAEVTNCAVLLIHHSRKPSGNELTVDDTRGASALLAAARSARIINTMTSQEAGDCEIEERERRRYFSSYVGKANLTTAPEERRWFKLVSINLDNGGFGDDVGVVTPYAYPTVSVPPITEHLIGRARDKIKAGGPWREDQRVTKEPWVGKPIADALGLDVGKKAHKKRVAKIVTDWLSKGILIRVERPDPHGDARPYVEAADRPPQGDASPAVDESAAASDEKLD